MKKTYIPIIVIVVLVLLLLGINRLGTRSGVTDAQVSESLPGDSIFPQPWISIDRSATYPVSAETAWPWVQQLGKDRAGWYAPEWLENAIKEHSATTTEDQFQHLAVGDVVPDWGGGSLQVLQIVPNSYVEYGSVGHVSASSTGNHYNFTWTLILENNTATSTTFHLRLRIPRPSSGIAQYIPPSLPGFIDYATDIVMFAGLREKLR